MSLFYKWGQREKGGSRKKRDNETLTITFIHLGFKIHPLYFEYLQETPKRKMLVVVKLLVYRQRNKVKK